MPKLMSDKMRLSKGQKFPLNTIISLDKSKNLRTTGIAWLIRDIAVSKDIGLQVYSFIKNSVALVMIGLIL